MTSVIAPTHACTIIDRFWIYKLAMKIQIRPLTLEAEDQVDLDRKVVSSSLPSLGKFEDFGGEVVEKSMNQACLAAEIVCVLLATRNRCYIEAWAMFMHSRTYPYGHCHSSRREACRFGITLMLCHDKHISM